MGCFSCLAVCMRGMSQQPKVSRVFGVSGATQIGGTIPCCHASQVHGDQPMTTDLAWWCQDAVLALLLGGVFQPPIRLGALMTLHAYDHLDAACVRPGCGCVARMDGGASVVAVTVPERGTAAFLHLSCIQAAFLHFSSTYTTCVQEKKMPQEPYRAQR